MQQLYDTSHGASEGLLPRALGWRVGPPLPARGKPPGTNELPVVL